MDIGVLSPYMAFHERREVMKSSKRLGIRGNYIVAFDGNTHRILKEGILVIENDKIVSVGKKYEGTVDQWIEANDRVITPGFLNTHCHINGAPLAKTIVDDIGNPQFSMSCLFDESYPNLQYRTEETIAASTAMSMVELLKSGTTTAVVMGVGDAEQVADIMHGVGMRGYVIPAIRSGSFFSSDGKVPAFKKVEKEGFDLLEKALVFSEICKKNYDGKIDTMLGPTWTANVVPELLKEIRKTAQQTGLRIQIHASEAVVEFREILRRHGMTPIRFLKSLGLLGNDLIIGHCIYISGHSWTTYPGDEDLRLLAQHGVSVAHCPWVFARKGAILESFSKYQKAGVNMSIGTDACPQNILLEMRYAALLSKICERDPRVTTAAHVFDAVTLGGARALGRDDLGRISPGAKADLLFFRLDSPRMRPVRDPIKNIVYYADPEDIAEVMIGGKMVMKHGQIEGIDIPALSETLQRYAEQMWKTIPEKDWAGRSVDQLSPFSYPLWEET
jgi:cytosine/adenosine deaminase-related metal-dependent hydrolase